MGEVVPIIPGLEQYDIPADEMLEKAKGWGMTSCVIVGLNEDGDLCFGGSICSGPEILYLLMKAQNEILNN